MFVVDTNVLLYAANADAAEHRRARTLVEEWCAGDESWFLTWGIVYEFCRVATHPRVFTAPLTLPDARTWIESLVGGRSDNILLPTDRHAAVLAEIVAMHPRLRGNLVHDLHIAVLMKEHGIPEIRTADTDFHQFKFLRVVNPLE